MGKNCDGGKVGYTSDYLLWYGQGLWWGQGRVYTSDYLSWYGQGRWWRVHWKFFRTHPTRLHVYNSSQVIQKCSRKKKTFWWRFHDQAQETYQVVLLCPSLCVLRIMFVHKNATDAWMNVSKKKKSDEIFKCVLHVFKISCALKFEITIRRFSFGTLMEHALEVNSRHVQCVLRNLQCLLQIINHVKDISRG